MTLNIQSSRVFKPLIVVGLTVFLILHIPLFISKLYFSQGVRAYGNQQYQTAADNFEVAVKWFPISANAYHMIAECKKKLALQSHTNQHISYGIQSYEKARQFDRYNPRYPAGIAYLSEMKEDTLRSIEEYKKLIQLQPLVLEYYEAYARVVMKEAQKEYANGNVQSAITYFQTIVRLEKDLEKQRNRVSPRVDFLKHTISLYPTNELHTILKKAKDRIDYSKKGEMESQSLRK